MNLIGLSFFAPNIVKGKFLLFFKLNFAPNFVKGSAILLKSLFDKLLSPINFIGFEEFINKPSISLPRVPEFSAFSVRFFLYLYPLIP